MTEKFSLRRDGEKALSEHFRVREFACRDGSDEILIDSELVALLEKLRAHFAAPVRVTSGYRTKAHNRAVGGSASSQHLAGKAADIRVDGVSVADAAACAEALMPNSGGIGRYPPKPGRAAGWLHLDVRKNKSRWTL